MLATKVYWSPPELVQARARSEVRQVMACKADPNGDDAVGRIARYLPESLIVRCQAIHGHTGPVRVAGTILDRKGQLWHPVLAADFYLDRGEYAGKLYVDGWELYLPTDDNTLSLLVHGQHTGTPIGREPAATPIQMLGLTVEFLGGSRLELPDFAYTILAAEMSVLIPADPRRFHTLGASAAPRPKSRRKP